MEKSNRDGKLGVFLFVKYERGVSERSMKGETKRNWEVVSIGGCGIEYFFYSAAT